MNHPIRPATGRPLNRRHFILTTGSALVLPWFLPESTLAARGPTERRILPMGPASKYVPRVRAAFVRRQGDYGMLWPGAVFDGEKARRDYTAQIKQAEKDLGVQIDLRPEPIYSAAEADAWLAEAKAAKPDGLLLMVWDRQAHAWPTAVKAADTGLPLVIFSPLGTAFTINTAPLAERTGVCLCSTNDFKQARAGLKMIRTAAKLREMRYLVLQGGERRDTEVAFFGTKLRYLPAKVFLEEYRATPDSEEIQSLAAEYLKHAKRIVHATKQDLLNGIKSFVVARRLLEREQADGITMDCLGALGKTEVSLPCIAWSKMLDQGIPAACEADLNAALTHALVQFLLERPGFQQDPVPETARDCLIGAHCSCPTRLHGPDQPPLPYDITHHHGVRDAVPRTQWKVGERMTVVEVILPRKPAKATDPATPAQMVVSTGTVAENIAVPPSGGCVVSVMVKLDTQPNLLSYPGFHQLFVCGDFKKELLGYCRLFGIQPVVA